MTNSRITVLSASSAFSNCFPFPSIVLNSESWFEDSTWKLVFKTLCIIILICMPCLQKLHNIQNFAPNYPKSVCSHYCRKLLCIQSMTVMCIIWWLLYCYGNSDKLLLLAVPQIHYSHWLCTVISCKKLYLHIGSNYACIFNPTFCQLSVRKKGIFP